MSKTYKHTRKGLMVGNIIAEHGDFVTFEFSEDQAIHYSGGVEHVVKGVQMDVRKELLKEVGNAE